MQQELLKSEMNCIFYEVLYIFILDSTENQEVKIDESFNETKM